MGPFPFDSEFDFLSNGMVFIRSYCFLLFFHVFKNLF